MDWEREEVEKKILMTAIYSTSVGQPTPPERWTTVLIMHSQVCAIFRAVMRAPTYGILNLTACIPQCTGFGADLSSMDCKIVCWISVKAVF